MSSDAATATSSALGLARVCSEVKSAPLATRPTGTVTFLFTDIEGSTTRWEQQRAALQGALRRHDALLRQAIDDQGGHVFKTVGNAVCAAFASPLAALEAALAGVPLGAMLALQQVRGRRLLLNVVHPALGVT